MIVSGVRSVGCSVSVTSLVLLLGLSATWLLYSFACPLIRQAQRSRERPTERVSIKRLPSRSVPSRERRASERACARAAHDKSALINVRLENWRRPSRTISEDNFRTRRENSHSFVRSLARSLARSHTRTHIHTQYSSSSLSSFSLGSSKPHRLPAGWLFGLPVSGRLEVGAACCCCCCCEISSSVPAQRNTRGYQH